MSGVELTEVREAHRIDEARLADYLAKEVAGFSGDMQLLQFEGGQSNPTYQVVTPEKRYVLRKQPPGELLPSAHQVDREYKVMHALRDTAVPVPEMFCLCEDASVLGTKFYVMEMVEGRVFTDGRMPGCSEQDQRGSYIDLARVLGELHSVKPEQLGLEEFGRPGNYYARQINRWSKQYVASKTDDLASMDRLMAWLPDNIPEDDASGIVHGDYRIGNVLLHPTEPRVSAVLDWELSTLGHPLGDLAYLCKEYHGVSSHGVNPDFEFPTGGIPTEDEMLHAYCLAAGRDKIENWDFYIIFNMFRSASIIQGVYKRGLDGNASSELALGFKDAARTISEVGADRLAKLI